MKTGKMKIFMASLLLCLTIGVTVLSGCSLISTNYEQYYKAIVASAVTKDGKKIQITKKDLITAYNSYGSQYVSYYGSSKEEAIKLTLDQLIMQKLIIDKVEKQLTEEKGANFLSEREKTYLWEATYDAIVKNIESFKSAEEESSQETDEKATLTKTDYVPSATWAYNAEKEEYEVKKLENAKTTINSYAFWSDGNKDASTALGKDEIYLMLNNLIKEDVVYAKAYSKYLSQLKMGEKGQNLSTENKAVMIREIERVYKIVYEGYMTTLYEELYKTDVTNVDANDILKLYKSKVLNDYATYDIEKSADYSTDILDTTKELFYHQESNVEYFYVTHILVKFTDKQQALYDEYNAVLNPGEDGKNGNGKYTIEEATNGINKLYEELYAKVRVQNDEGEYIEDNSSKKEITPIQVLEDVKKNVKGTSAEKAEAFYELMFKYTEDDASTLNANYQYVIGVDYSQNTYNEDGSLKYSYKPYSSMVESFTEDAISLYDHGDGEIGDYSSSLVKSNYGYHILMYGGKVQNLCDDISFSMNLDEEEIMTKLFETRLNACRNYTYFDKLYDELVKDNFEVYRTKDIKHMKSQLTKYTYYKNAYKDMI